MRIVTLILIVLLLLLQYPLWLGRGGWLRVWDLHRQVEAQKLINAETAARNATLDAEVRDLKQGTEAIEERARNDLGMVRKDEIYYQILDDASAASSVIQVKPDASSPAPARPDKKQNW